MLPACGKRTGLPPPRGSSDDEMSSLGQPAESRNDDALKIAWRQKRYRAFRENRAPAIHSAATGGASAHSSGSSSSLRFGKQSAQPNVMTEKMANTVVTAATLPVRS